MIELTLLLLAAAVGFAVSRWTKLPSIPILLLAGLGMAAVYPLDSDFVEDAITLGVTVLVFVAGIELNPRRLRGRGWIALQVGVGQFMALGLIGLGAALFLGFPLETALYLSLALTASSTLVVVKLLQERRLLFEPVGRLVTGVLLLQDLLIILSIPAVIRYPDGPWAMAYGVLGTLGLVALSGIVLRWVAPKVSGRLAGDEEMTLLLSLSLLFVFMGLANFLDLPLVTGAFLAGVALSGFPAAALVRGQINSLGDFFHALLFAGLGAFLSLPTGTELVQASLLVLMIILITPPLVAWISEHAGLSARPAISTGLLLSQTSEFSLVIALQGLALGRITPGVFTVITLVTVTTMILTPVLASDRMTWALMKIHPFKRIPSSERIPESHVLLLGCGRHGQELLEALIIARDEIVVLDQDPALVAHLRAAGVQAVRGDAADLNALRRVGADRAQIIISTIRRRDDNIPVLELAADVPILVRGFNKEDGEWIRKRGGQPILYSEAAAGHFKTWYEEEWKDERMPSNPNGGGGRSGN